MSEEQKSSYKLIYFNARGRAEHIRYIFAHAGVDYIDERVPKERWPEVKRSMPYGMLPVLEIDGKPIAQSNAVGRFLARKYGLAGQNEWESMLCDVLVDTLGDLKLAIKNPFTNTNKSFFLNKFYTLNIRKTIELTKFCPTFQSLIFQYRTEEDPLKKEEKKVKLLKETIPFYLNKFEQTIVENGGFAVGSVTTWADFVLAVALENFEQIFGVAALDNYPGLRGLKQRVHEIPEIVEWLAKRPLTDF
ncbi:GSCOCT00003673001.2-RA-CDS [Cotesia congregata]|uniref:glutathione transferase n=1 Tax=Cotesia congregata TaxID=51543 RepID=A0A8J2HSY8_COTCN|nr:GSCOCT00003673001.2-RA-CDS [Cotesia congregata]CAG5107489.1 glutathione S-transferase Theta [Cotesia congregata]